MRAGTATQDEPGLVLVEVRSQYGRPAVHPANELARTLADLAGHTTLTERDLQCVRRLPGFTVQATGAAEDVPAWVTGGRGTR